MAPGKKINSIYSLIKLSPIFSVIWTLMILSGCSTTTPGTPPEMRKIIYSLFKKGVNKAEIERRTGVSRRSVGRILGFKE
jgi:DNA invertase Pin-like site-specific DNA recombinase